MGGVGVTAYVILLVCAFNSVNSFSKYGRGCGDIGCMPSEECIIATDSCSYSQREGKDCGSYPTCKKKNSAGSTSPVHPPGSVLNPGYPHGLQPVNPYNPPFVFGQQPFYSPAGTGGPPGGINYSGFQNPNMYNKPPPQYQNQNQNPYNRQTQSHSGSATVFQGDTARKWQSKAVLACGCILAMLLSKITFVSST